MTHDLYWTLAVFWAFCIGVLVGGGLRDFIRWYELRQEARIAMLRRSMPVGRVYPHRIVEFPPKERLNDHESDSGSVLDIREHRRD